MKTYYLIQNIPSRLFTPFTHPSCLPASPLPQILSPSICNSEKSRHPRENCLSGQNSEKMQKFSHQYRTKQPSRGNESQEKAKDSEEHLLPLKECITNTHSQFADHSHTEPILCSSVPVRPCEHCLADSVDHVILVSSIPSHSYNLSSPSFMGSPEL